MKVVRLACTLVVAGGLGCALAWAEPAMTPPPPGPSATASPLPWLEPVPSEKPMMPGDTVLLGRDGTLEVRECLDYARANHPKLKAAQARYDQAVGKLRVDEALYVPTGQINVLRSHTYTQNGGLSPAVPGTNPTTILLQPAATLQYLLNDGGYRSLSVRRDRANLLTYAFDWRNQWRQLAFQIELDYLDVLLQRALLQVQEDSVRMADATLKQAQGLFRAGKKTRLDVLQSQTDLEGARAQFVRQKGTLARAWTTLGIDSAAPVNEFAALEPLLTTNLPLPEVSKYLELAFTQRSDVLSYANQVAVQRYQIQVNKTALNPTLNALLQYGYTGGDFPLLTQWQGALTLTIPLTQGPTVRGQNLQAEGQITELLAQIYNLRLTITGDLSRNFLLRKEAVARIAVVEGQVREAEQAYKLAERRYMGGICQYIEMTNARQVLNSARSDLANAYTDCRKAEISMLAAMEEAFPREVAPASPTATPAPPASPASPMPANPAPAATPSASPSPPASAPSPSPPATPTPMEKRP